MTQTVLARRTPAPPLRLGERIRAAREAAGLTQRELAALIGLSSATAVHLYEQGRRQVSAAVLWRIAHATRTPVGSFFRP